MEHITALHYLLVLEHITTYYLQFFAYGEHHFTDNFLKISATFYYLKFLEHRAHHITYSF